VCGEGKKGLFYSKEIMKKTQTGKQTDRQTGTQPSHPLQDYAAKYLHPGYGTLSVTLEKTRLVARFNATEFPLEHYHYDTFEIGPVTYIVPLAGEKISFFLDQGGNTERLTFPLELQVKAIEFVGIPD
jgi:hypothetical protein